MNSSVRLRNLVVLVGFLLRVAIALRPSPIGDRFFVPDDAYYTLSIARSMAHGLGPTADGVHLTNGFQPLLAFVIVPIFWLTKSLDAPLVAAQLFGALCDALSAWLISELAGRAVTPARKGFAQILAATFWSLSPVAVANSLNGLETSLAVFAVLAFVSAYQRARDSESLPWFAGTGALAGIALLARVDSIFVVALVGVFELFRGRATRVLLMAAPGFVVVFPWWGYEFVRLGSVVPESGAAVRAQAAYHQSIYLTPLKQLAWAVGTLMGPPLSDLAPLRSFLMETPAIALVLTLAFLAFAFVKRALIASWAKKEPVVALLFAAVLAIVLFYTFYVPALWFFRRYFAIAFAVLAIAWAMACARAFEFDLRKAKVATFALVAIASVQTAIFLALTPKGSWDGDLNGAKGYREAARAILEAAPDGSVIGAFQSGALGYFASEFKSKNLRIVNLDGVVDREAARAYRESRVASFAQERGMTHLADWEFNLTNFISRSGDPTMTRASFEIVATAPAQGDDAMQLARVTYRASPP